MKKGIICGAMLLTLLLSIQLMSFALQLFGKDDKLAPVGFREVWGYLMRGDEQSFRSDMPVTDICYFSCGVNSKGRINMKVNPPVLPYLNGKKRRVHIVISDLTNSGLMHYSLNPGYNVRDYLIDDILELSKKFDGVQIDFEAVKSGDAADFRKFLSLIKMGLDGGKIFSVALPARMSRVARDPYDYTAIARIADRVYIMAYDQHWSTGTPGPVASLSWCSGVMDYARSKIPAEKLVMGIPLYGRAWYNRKESCSINSGQVKTLLANKSAVGDYSAESGIKITFRDSDVIVYYDNVDAIKEKFILYRSYADSVGFWRLGMETPGIWKEIRVME